MKKFILLVLVAFFANGVHAQDFITVWNLNKPGSSTNSITFGVGTTGTVNYTWETIPVGTTGSGTFTGTTVTISGLPTSAKIRLKINPINFNQIIINNNLDKSRLVDVEQWGDVVWTSMETAFKGCDTLNISATDVPNLSSVTNMESMFRECIGLNSPANMDTWNMSNITNMSYMFYITSFNQPIGNWNTSNVTNMGSMFYGSNFNQPIGNWNTSNVTNMGSMFYGSNFNQPISNWNTTNVTDMIFMFSNALAFNQPIGNWNTSNVNNMSFMFENAYNFNQPIGNWNTSNVTNMSWMFSNAHAFNQPIGNWNTSNVTRMDQMFQFATNFNQPIGNWNTSNVTYMNQMFANASNFNQALGNWNLTALINNQSMLDNCGMDCTNYSSTLNGWSNNINTPNALNLGAAGISYGTNAVSSRNYLLNTKGWTIIGDAMSNTTCYPTNTLSINTNNQITISPNPTNSIFKIECPMNGANVILYNSFGQKLLTTTIENQTSLLDISHFSKGIYIAEIIDDKTTYRIKIIKD
jgi:surface protein